MLLDSEFMGKLFHIETRGPWKLVLVEEQFGRYQKNIPFFRNIHQRDFDSAA